MPAAISNDLRKRIMEAKEQGKSHAKIAEEMRVNKSTITRLMALYRETGSYEPRPLNNGRKPRLDESTLQKIRERIEKQPDIALQELIDDLELPVSVPALCKTINKKLGLGRKKNSTRRRAASTGCGPTTKSMEAGAINPGLQSPDIP